MLFEILKQKRNQLERACSYMLPHLDKIMYLVQELEQNAGDDYFDAFKCKELHKGEYLLQEGDVCRHMWFLENGIARVFDRKDGVEVTRYFFFPGELIDAYCSSSQQIPSEVNIQIIQDSTVYSLNRNTFKKLTLAYPVISEIEKLIVQCHTIWLEHRIYEIQHFDALDHYNHLLSNQMPLVRNISVTYIASYMGVSIEWLSRVKKNMDKR